MCFESDVSNDLLESAGEAVGEELSSAPGKWTEWDRADKDSASYLLAIAKIVN